MKTGLRQNTAERSALNRLPLVLLLATLQGCMQPSYVRSTSPIQPGQQDQTQDPNVLFHLSDQWNAQPPECIAILPLTATSLSPELKTTVRNALQAQLAPLGYRQIPISVLDQAQQSLSVPANKDRLSALAETVNCDAFLVGNITRFDEHYLGLYSRISAGAYLEIRRPGEEQPIWNGRHTASLESGGLPLSPVGLASTLLDTALNLREEQRYRVADDLGRRLLRTLPPANLNIDHSAKSKLQLKAETPAERKVAQPVSDLPSPQRHLKAVKGEQTPIDLVRLKGLPTEQAVAQIHQWLANTENTPSVQDTLYEHLIQIQPTSTAFRNWSDLAVSQGDYETALQRSNQALQLQPDDPTNHIQVARLQSVMNRPSQAEAHYLKAISLAPDSPRYYAELAYNYQQTGDLNRARAAYALALEKDPQLGFAWYNLGVMEWAAGRPEDAARSLHLAASAYMQSGLYHTAEAVISDLEQIPAQHNLNHLPQLRADLARMRN